MENEKSKISSLIVKANAIKVHVAKLKEERKALVKKNDELKSILDKEKNTTFELLEEIKILKLAKQIDSDSSNNKEVKNKINELIKEVDKCIAYLSD